MTLGDDPDLRYLQVDPQIQCSTPEHFRLAFSIALPSLIFWGAGIPFIAFLVLLLYRNKLDDVQIKAKFGFLYEGYNKRHFYW